MKNPTRFPLSFGVLFLVITMAFSAHGAGSTRTLNGTRKCASADFKGAQALMEFRTRLPANQRLPSEIELDEFRPLMANWMALPRQRFFTSTTFNGVASQVAVQELNTGAGGTVYVCIHGIFSEGKDWRYLCGALNGEGEIWLVDLPGCGASDVLEPKQVGPGGYSTRALAERVLQALEARLTARPDVQNLILVGHSMGGMVILRMFLDDEIRLHHAQVLERVDGLALFAPSDVVVTQATDTWLTFLGIDPFKARVGSMLQILHGKVAGSVRESFTKSEWGSRELAGEGVTLLRDGVRRRAMQQILIEAVPWRTFGKHVDWDAIRTLEAGYRNVTVPCLLVWGKCDETLPEPIGHKLNDQLPNARLVLVAESMHLLQLERPVLCANLLREFRRQLTAGDLAAARTIQTLEPDEAAQPLMAASE